MLSFDADGEISATTFKSDTPPSVLSRDHIIEAVSKSLDDGATLDLAHKGLTDIDEYGAEELAKLVQDVGRDHAVIRLALAYNHLTTLPMAFALLSRLRYLVLRNNNFAQFPFVLTLMPSLEILDISRNQIERLPAVPGSLLNLRVFSLLRNRVHRLPSYIPQFRNLSILRIDQNPIEWPPNSVLVSHGDLHDAEVMTEWVKNLQAWIQDNHSVSDRIVDETSLQSASSMPRISDLARTNDHSPAPPTPPPKDALHATALYHARSFSLQSDSSSYFQIERSHSESAYSQSSGARLNWPAPVGYTRPRLSSTSPSPPRSPDSYYPPDGSGPPTDEEEAGKPRVSQPMEDTTGSNAREEPRLSTNSSNLTVKKSMPELRLTTDKIDLGSSQRSAAQLTETNGLHSPLRRTFLRDHDEVPSASPIDRPVPVMDKERHAYFRRLSALTPLNLAKSIPEDLLALVDAVRGVLFGVSQIYQSLHHYTEYAIDERLSAVLSKVLDPASVYMSQLINALDRFDSVSKRSVPSPAICRAVVESCRDNVTVFGKAVAVLALQLKVLATHNDVRYTRQILLTLYGAMGEIASSWQAMSTRIEAVRPMLWETRPPPVAKSYSAQGTRITNSHGTDTSWSPVSAPGGGASFMSSVDYPRFRPSPSAGVLDHGKTRMTRRHAGSFSSKDVEIGKMLPSFDEAPSLSAGVLSGTAPLTPVPRISRRYGPLQGSSAVDWSGPYSADFMQQGHRNDAHSRQGSQSSLVASMSSPSVAFRLMHSDHPSSTSTLMDKDAIEAMKQALAAAPALWEMMGEILSDEGDTQQEMRDILDRARDVADRLRQSVDRMQDSPTPVERIQKPLHDDARMFAKTVIQLSSAMKAHITTHPLSSTVRTNMVKLTNATEEFVILLHVSSFSRTTTPRPYSPFVVPPGSLITQDDGKLGANLSRARSAVPSAGSGFMPALREPPHTALPHQTFSIPNPPRFGPLRKDTLNDATAIVG